MSSFNKYDFMSGRELKYEVKKRGLPINQNQAAYKMRAVCLWDDQGKIPSSFKFMKGSSHRPDYYELLQIVNRPQFEN